MSLRNASMMLMCSSDHADSGRLSFLEILRPFLHSAASGIGISRENSCMYRPMSAHKYVLADSMQCFVTKVKALARSHFSDFEEMPCAAPGAWSSFSCARYLDLGFAAAPDRLGYCLQIQ